MSSPGRISGWMPCCACGVVRLGLKSPPPRSSTLNGAAKAHMLRIDHVLLGQRRASGSSAIAMEMRWRQDGSRVENEDAVRMRDEQARGADACAANTAARQVLDTGTVRRFALFGVRLRTAARSSRSRARSARLRARWLVLCCCAGVATCGQKGPLAPPPDEARAGDSPSVAAAPRVAGAGAAGRKQTLA